MAAAPAARPAPMQTGGAGYRGATRVLVMSSTAFTLMFAVWLMFGVLGVPIQAELGLSEPQLAWISAVAVLNGSMWRLPAGRRHIEPLSTATAEIHASWGSLRPSSAWIGTPRTPNISHTANIRVKAVLDMTSTRVAPR